MLFTFDIDGRIVLLELDARSLGERYENAACVARDFLSKRMKSEVQFWPAGLIEGNRKE